MPHRFLQTLQRNGRGRARLSSSIMLLLRIVVMLTALISPIACSGQERTPFTVTYPPQCKDSECANQRFLDAIKEAEGHSDAKDVILWLNFLLRAYASESKYQLTVDAFNKHFGKDERAIQSHSLEASNIYYYLGRAYTKLGQWKDAEKALKQSIQIRRCIPGSNIETPLQALELVFIKSDRLSEAEDVLEEIIRIDQHYKAVPTERRVVYMHLLAHFYAVQRKYSKAESVYKRTLSIYQNMPTLEPSVAVEYGKCLRGFAKLLRATNRRKEADQMELKAKSLEKGMITTPREQDKNK